MIVDKTMMIHRHICFILLIFAVNALQLNMKKCKGGACPYMAAWLTHINMYRRVAWYLYSTKMEEASFKIFDNPSVKYQLENHDHYIVHHMSEYEHLIHKKYGFPHARNATALLSHAAYNGECVENVVNKKWNKSDYISFIPFHGGLPPDVTENFIVKSIGQGNSLVGAWFICSFWFFSHCLFH